MDQFLYDRNHHEKELIFNTIPKEKTSVPLPKERWRLLVVNQVTIEIVFSVIAQNFSIFDTFLTPWYPHVRVDLRG